MVKLLGVEFGRTALTEIRVGGARDRLALLRALDDHVALELRERQQHVAQQRVHRVVGQDAKIQHVDGDALVDHIGDETGRLRHRPREAVELGDDEHIALSQLRPQPVELRALDLRAGEGVRIDFFRARRCQRLLLRVQTVAVARLRLGRDSRVAEYHVNSPVFPVLTPRVLNIGFDTSIIAYDAEFCNRWRNFKDISSYFNEIRTLNSTRYIYTATKNEEGKLVYVVDGLDPDADDVRHPGDYIEDEMVPYIDRAISGENVYSQDIIDTTWGPIFTACYPVSANHDGTGEIIGAFCIEMDMQSAYGMVEKTNHISIICGLVAGAVLLLICLYTYYVYQKSKAEEQKQKQLLMTAAEEANAANKAKSAFLLSISHDIRTPMNAIIGFTNIALHQNTVSDIHASLEKVQQSSNHLLSLLNDVLDFTRIESGKVTISPEPVDITQLTDNVQAIMNGLLYNRDLKFEVHREIPKNLYVLADVVRIREVLVNLLGNAVKFTKDGGKITLDISSYPGADEKHIITRYVVRDNGIGMSEEFQKKLFDPFSQEDDANARTQYKGTGLGMAITKKYVDMMGGSIDVESKKGVGSTFTVEIPMELPEQVIQSEQKQHLHRDLTGIHVLMAEDNDLNAELATIMLEDAGMTVTRASDGKEVVNLFKNHPRGTYDLILMDIMMPNMDGHQAAKAIRALGIERSDAVTIPIIALSANAFIDDIQESLNSGMNDHISKPINMEELIDTITKYIKRD